MKRNAKSWWRHEATETPTDNACRKWYNHGGKLAVSWQFKHKSIYPDPAIPLLTISVLKAPNWKSQKPTNREIVIHSYDRMLSSKETNLQYMQQHKQMSKTLCWAKAYSDGNQEVVTSGLWWEINCKGAWRNFLMFVFSLVSGYTDI